MSNYSATIVKIDNIRPHSNADRLNCTTIFLNTVIIGKNVKEGDIGVYFPVETQLSSKFCQANDLIRRDEIVDGKKNKAGGMFDANRRVRAQRFRGEESMGFWVEIDALEKWANFVGIKLPKFKDGDSFEEINGEEVCSKFIPKVRGSGGPSSGGGSESLNQFVDGQFAFHVNTSQFGRNLSNFELDDVISISYKVHGTSVTARKVLKKQKFLWFNAKPKYGFVVSSRNTVKRPSLTKYDLWVDSTQMCKDVLYDGLAIYGEIAGFNKTGGIIQSGYDYGCDKDGQVAPFNKLFVYRITYTSPSGNVIEFSSPQIQEFCKKFGLETPKVFYTGTVRDYLVSRGIDTAQHWQKEWALKMKEEFNEKDCFMCKNNVPEEGVVIRKEGLAFEAYKLKSSRFLEKETQLLDKGEEILS